MTEPAEAWAWLNQSSPSWSHSRGGHLSPAGPIRVLPWEFPTDLETKSLPPSLGGGKRIQPWSPSCGKSPSAIGGNKGIIQKQKGGGQPERENKSMLMALNDLIIPLVTSLMPLLNLDI